MEPNTLRRTRRLLASGFLTLILAASLAPSATDAAPGCRKATVSGANQTIDPSHINQRLLNRAIVAEVNYIRCKRNLPKLSSPSSLHKVSVGHARWMAKSRRLSHKSSVRGKQTLVQRIQSTGIKARSGSENILKVTLYRLDEVGSFRISNRSTCSFATSGGTRIGRHTYASLARHSANLWYNSRGHRKNMLDGRVRMVGTGAGFDGKANNCGDIYLTQAFAG